MKNSNDGLNPNAKANYEVFKKRKRIFMGFLDVLNDVKLSPSARLLFLIISTLVPRKGYCYATNDFLSRRFGKSTSRVKFYLSELEKAGLIETEIVISTQYGRWRHISIPFHIMRRRYLKNQIDSKN